MTPEWSRPERLDTIGEQDRRIEIAADERERAALARRFGIVAIDKLAAHLIVRREASGILVTGTVTADLVQACSITGDALPVAIDEPVAVRFVEPSVTGEEIELSADALDTIEIEGGAIDLGEAAAETMALSLDPFPRGPNAAAALKDAGVVSEDEVTPFNAFAGLKAKLEGRA
ncbi:hypothetical protein ASG67_10390 [Sphingomonas sp. Leaf339]|uniref:YceD family protein n=1 Tax=Sphingomonas sp. Leaf339 TaxID=1736343 RepID=UPI0006FF025A|nr:DUF177 domain-containing protein [Sphingomonas sp. Leaf339]KQU53210.1 hypothetical protein ASG67_10390 [Sphingomonas sp. Leaf339]